MNCIDVFTIGLFLLFLWMGYRQKILVTLVRLGSLAGSFFLARAACPHIRDFLAANTRLSDAAGGFFTSNLMKLTSKVPPDVSLQTLVLDGLLKSEQTEILFRHCPSLSMSSTVAETVEGVSGALSEEFLELVGFLGGFLVIALLAAVLVRLLTGLLSRAASRFPALNMLSRLGGLVLGGALGILVLFILFTIPAVLETLGLGSGFVESVKTSFSAGLFYDRNLVLDLLNRGGILESAHDLIGLGGVIP